MLLSNKVNNYTLSLFKPTQCFGKCDFMYGGVVVREWPETPYNELAFVSIKLCSLITIKLLNSDREQNCGNINSFSENIIQVL